MRFGMKKLFTVLAALALVLPARAYQTSKGVSVENSLLEIVKNISLFGYNERTSESLRNLVKRDSTNDAVFFYLGKSEYANGDMAAAEEHFKKACTMDPSNDDYAEELAGFYAMAGRSADACDIYFRLLEKNPLRYRNAYTLSLLADQQMRDRKDSLALENYEAALLFDPKYAPAILGRSEIYRMHGNLPAFFTTIKDFTTDPDINPYPKCEYVNSILDRVDSRSYQVWQSQLDSMVMDCVRTHPSDSSALKLAGRWFYRTGNEKKASKYFDEFLKNYPTSMEPHFIRLQLLAAADDTHGMISECRSILDLADGAEEYFLPAMSTLGDCYYELGDKKEAFKCYDKALKKNPDYLPVLNNYAYYLSLLGKRLGKALKMSLKTVENEPDNPTYLDTYGWLLHLCGKDKEAKPYFKHALLYGGNENSEVLHHYSEVLKALGENDLADYYSDLSKRKK